MRLRDVARIEIGGQSYATAGRIDGEPTSFVGVQLSPIANALSTATAVKEKMKELSKYFPLGIKYDDSLRHLEIRQDLDRRSSQDPG